MIAELGSCRFEEEVVVMVVVVVGGMSVQRGSLGGEVHVREGRYMYGKGVKEEVPPSASRHLCRYKYRYRYR